MRGTCFRCRAPTQTATGPEDGKDHTRAVEVALVELTRFIGYRYDDAEGEPLLICSRCMVEVVNRALKDKPKGNSGAS